MNFSLFLTAANLALSPLLSPQKYKFLNPQIFLFEIHNSSPLLRLCKVGLSDRIMLHFPSLLEVKPTHWTSCPFPSDSETTEPHKSNQNYRYLRIFRFPLKKDFFVAESLTRTPIPSMKSTQIFSHSPKALWDITTRGKMLLVS